MFYNASTKLSAKNWPSDILFVGNINKYVIIMHLICINHNSIINKPFSTKKGRSNTLYMCLYNTLYNTLYMGRDLKGGGQIDPPPPSKNLLSKSPVKIGLRQLNFVTSQILHR